MRFYEFQLRWKSHSGCVYYMMPYLMKGHSWEDKYWFAYINGCSQHVVTTWIIFNEFPSLHRLNIRQFDLWFREHYSKLGWDTDRRYVKTSCRYALRTTSGILEKAPKKPSSIPLLRKRISTQIFVLCGPT